MGILIELVKDIFARRVPPQAPAVKDDAKISSGNKVLNVGGGSKATPIPAYFSDWQHDLLDIDDRGNPDLVCDARELSTLEASQ